MLEPLQLVIGYNSLDLIGGFPKNISWTIVLTSPFLATKVKKRTTLHPIGDSKVFPFGNEAQSHLGILQYLCLQFRLHRLRQNLPHSGQMLKPYQNWRLWKDQTHQAVRGFCKWWDFAPKGNKLQNVVKMLGTSPVASCIIFSKTWKHRPPIISSRVSKKCLGSIPE